MLNEEAHTHTCVHTNPVLCLPSLPRIARLKTDKNMEKRGLSAGQKRPEKGRNQIEENDGNPREKERWNRKRGERDKEFFREGPSKQSRAVQGRGPDERVRSVRVQSVETEQFFITILVCASV